MVSFIIQPLITCLKKIFFKCHICTLLQFMDCVFQHIATLYGEYLSEKSKDEEAGIMFVKAECWEQALSSFQDCKNWRQVFCMTARLKYGQDKEVDIAKKLSGNLF